MNMRVSKKALALIPAGIIFYSLSVIAEPKCPQNISPKNARRTMTSYTGGNIPLEHPVLVENQGEMYRIPVGYFFGWPSEKHKLRNGDVIGNELNEIQHREVIEIAFWMPAVRYPERNLIYAASFYPCEDGRPPVSPAGDEYIVRINVQPMKVRDDGTFVTPLQMYKGAIGFAEQNGGLVTKEEHGLLWFEGKKYPDPNTSHYRHLNEAVPEVLMDCVKPHVGIGTPFCNAKVYYPKSKLYFTMHFPARHLPHWHEIVDATTGLLEKWRVSNPKKVD